MTRLTEIRERRAKITPGNWIIETEGNDANASFIASSPADIDWLIARVETLEAVVAAAKSFVIHGHPMGGACSTDHYDSPVLCDCGFELMLKAISAAKDTP